jgi:hypothetical protein
LGELHLYFAIAKKKKRNGKMVWRKPFVQAQRAKATNTSASNSSNEAVNSQELLETDRISQLERRAGRIRRPPQRLIEEIGLENGDAIAAGAEVISTQTALVEDGSSKRQRRDVPPLRIAQRTLIPPVPDEDQEWHDDYIRSLPVDATVLTPSQNPPNNPPENATPDESLPSGPIEVTKLQNCITLRHEIMKSETKQRVFSRMGTWLHGDTAFREVNAICNKEASVLKKNSIQPNLPEIARRKFDDQFIYPQKVDFSVKLYQANSEQERCSCRIISFFRDFHDAITCRIVSNREANFGSIGKKYEKCGSLSEVFQTPYFKTGEEKCKAAFGSDVKLVPVDIYGDSALLNVSSKETIHAVQLQIDGGYDRHAKARNFDRYTITVGWIPPLKDFKVKVGSIFVEWDQVNEADQKELTLKLNKEISEFIIEEFQNDLTNKVFQFPYPDIGKVAFQLSTLKLDQPEKNRWTNTIHCQVCSAPDQLLLSEVHFRTRDQPGYRHDNGILLEEVFKPLGVIGDTFEPSQVVDLMHCTDNVLKHVLRIVVLKLCSSRADKSVTVDGVTYRAAVESFGLVLKNVHTNEIKTVGAQSISKEDRITTQENSCRNTKQWKTLRERAKSMGGKQSADLIESSGSMEDRVYGLPGLLFALEFELFYSSNFSRLSVDERRNIFYLVMNVYKGIILLTDCAPGFLLPELRTQMEEFRDLYLQLASEVGIHSLPISVHTFVHFLSNVQRFGAPNNYDVKKEESHHVQTKSAVLNNTNYQMGESGFDKLIQVLVREARRDVFTYVFATSEQPSPISSPQCSQWYSVRYASRTSQADDEVEIDTDAEDVNANRSIVDMSLDRVRKVFGIKDTIEPNAVHEANTYKDRWISISVIDVDAKVAVFPEVVIPWAIVNGDSQLRLMAVSPPHTAAYKTSRDNFFNGKESCKNKKCFACSGVEYSSTIAVNRELDLRDRYFIPLGTKLTSDSTALSLGLEVSVMWDSTKVVQRVSLTKPYNISEINMNRFRDVCNFARYKCDNQNEFRVIERLRGRKS